MTPGSSAALFAALVILAAVPSVSTLTVAARAAAYGFRHGAYTVLGIVVADLMFILAAIYGLTLLAITFGDLFIYIKYLGGAYLLWSGIVLLRAAGNAARTTATGKAAPRSGFLTGLMITLADQKAILFYLGFFPAFLDLAALSVADTAIILLVAIVAVGGVKLGYAWLAGRGGALRSTRLHREVNRVAGGVMLLVGVLVLVRT